MTSLFDQFFNGTAPVDVMLEPTQQGMVAWFDMVMRDRQPTPDEARKNLLEEVAELTSAIALEGAEAQLKELADVLYVCYGYANARGWNLHRAFQLVHESNLLKEPTPEGKIAKGPNYVAPDLSSCIGENT